jgi:hypothetical protein
MPRKERFQYNQEGVQAKKLGFIHYEGFPDSKDKIYTEK